MRRTHQLIFVCISFDSCPLGCHDTAWSTDLRLFLHLLDHWNPDLTGSSQRLVEQWLSRRLLLISKWAFRDAVRSMIHENRRVDLRLFWDDHWLQLLEWLCICADSRSNGGWSVSWNATKLLMQRSNLNSMMYLMSLCKGDTRVAFAKLKLAGTALQMVVLHVVERVSLGQVAGTIFHHDVASGATGLIPVLNVLNLLSWTQHPQPLRLKLYSSKKCRFSIPFWSEHRSFRTSNRNIYFLCLEVASISIINLLQRLRFGQINSIICFCEHKRLTKKRLFFAL